ncbi:PREDICTED: uncharacterized protein LOC105569628 [Vollenhovia emeryi]|uniref:uncharacterized protein LOC105569628 n=1 Tax=Vollenhovia emeryi TaxID=411798 RepID=UPI0005F4939E|nr:PREDICTED: uncharacterized protein LOC105569628 [Vollenhovia emeryi]
MWEIYHCRKFTSPFIDETGLLRVGGRIRNSLTAFDTKHPIILPAESTFTKLLFKREHRRLLHAGPQTLLYAIREKYWPLRGKNLARKVVHECMTCFRNNPKPLSQVMGQLPADRAIHLEAVSDLSSNAFIAALRRFAGRRGCPQRIYCDNATNFVGARNELNENLSVLVREHLRSEQEGQYTAHELIYGHQATLPTALTQPPRPTYSYDDYAQELRERMRATQQAAKEQVIIEKEKEKAQYDKRTKNVEFNVDNDITNNSLPGRLKQ